MPKTDYIVVLKDGKISEAGTYQELLARKGAFAEFLIEYMNEEGDEDEIENIKHQLEDSMGRDKFQEMSRQISHQSDHHDPILEEELNGVRRKTLSESSVASEESTHRRKSVAGLQKSESVDQKPAPGPGPNGAKLIEKEVAQTGSVKLAVYGYYMRNVGWFGVAAGK